MNLSEIGARIKAERKRLNLSQEKMSEMINVTPHYIYEIERGLKAMSLETLINISEALKLSTDYILFDDEKNNDFSLYEQLDKMSDEQRLRAETAFSVLLPYIK